MRTSDLFKAYFLKLKDCGLVILIHCSALNVRGFNCYYSKFKNLICSNPCTFWVYSHFNFHLVLNFLFFTYKKKYLSLLGKPSVVCFFCNRTWLSFYQRSREEQNLLQSFVKIGNRARRERLKIRAQLHY
jgi:hypothetical protein